MNQDLYDLLSGAIVAGSRGTGQAGNGNQLVGDDVWTGIDTTNLIVRSQQTESPFVGEHKLYRGCPRFASRSTATVFAANQQLQIGKPTFSGAYNGATARVYFAAFVSVNNASPGDLTGTSVSWTLVNADTAATVASGTATGWTGASDTKALSANVSLTLTLTAGQTFIAGTNAVMWLRAYTTTFTDGIDYFPDAAKISGAITVANTSGGANAYTVTTDYDIVQEAHLFPRQSTTIGVSSIENDWGYTGAGCGIAWDVTGSPAAVGANYFVPATYQVYAGYLRVPILTTDVGNRHVRGGPMEFWDGVQAQGRGVITNIPTGAGAINAPATLNMGQLFAGAAQAGTTHINFWISATKTKLVIILQGDTGQGGRLIMWTLQRYTTLVATDLWPWIWFPDGSSVSTQMGSHLVTSKYVYDQPYWGDPAISLGGINAPFYYSEVGTVYRANIRSMIANTTGTPVDGGIPNSNPNSWDVRWWLYTLYHAGFLGGGNSIGTFDAAEQGSIRGKLRGIFAMSGDGFTSLDELVDGSDTYLLIKPTTLWGGQSAGGGARYDSLAILEE